MSFFRIFKPLTDADEYPSGSSIRSATGLSRAVLAALFIRDGLFGRESALAPIEQAVVQSRLGPIPGLRAKPAPDALDARLLALSAFTERAAAAKGRVTRGEAQALVQAGYSEAAVSEVVRRVHAVLDVFGRRAVPAAGDVRLDTLSPSSLDKAA